MTIPLPLNGITNFVASLFHSVIPIFNYLESRADMAYVQGGFLVKGDREGVTDQVPDLTAVKIMLSELIEVRFVDEILSPGCGGEAFEKSTQQDFARLGVEVWTQEAEVNAA